LSIILFGPANVYIICFSAVATSSTSVDCSFD